MTVEYRRSDLIYDWNAVAHKTVSGRRPEFDDETLRDGLQGPSVVNPTLDQKLEILHLIEALGIDGADIGLPGAGPVAYEHVLELSKEIQREGMKILPNCAARTVRADIEPIARAMDAAGVQMEAAIFLGCSQIRQVVENWDLDFLLKTTETAVKLAVDLGLVAMYVTEDTTRTHPEIVTQLYRCAIENGARRVVVADTVGHSTPAGAASIIRHVKSIIEESGVRTGTAHVFNVGSTGAIGTIEFEPGLQGDMPEILDQLVPPSRDYGHERTWHDGNGHSHLQATWMGPEITVPVRDGEPVLGTWQQIFHLECDIKAHRRRIVVTVRGD